MKRLFLIASLFLVANSTFGAWVVGTNSDILGYPYGTKVIFHPITGPLSENNKIILDLARTTALDAYGGFRIQLAGGYYNMDFGPAVTPIEIAVPANNTNTFTAIACAQAVSNLFTFGFDPAVIQSYVLSNIPPQNLRYTNTPTPGSVAMVDITGTNWAYLPFSSGSATNAVATVSSNGVAVGIAVTNLNIWPGTNTTAELTNRNGLVDIRINSTASGISNNMQLPGLAGATNFSSMLIYVADEVLTNGIADTSGTYRIQIDANDTAIRGPFGGLFYVTSTNAVLGALQRYIGNGAGLTNLSITNYLIPNAGSTNLGVQSLNSSNIYIGADSPAGGPNATFTNSSYSIAIGSRFPVGGISGNNAIYIGGSAGGAGPNSLSLGVGAGSGGVNEDGSTSQAGSIAIGNQVDCFSRNSMVISAGTSSGMQFFGINNAFIGNNDSDAYNLTNVFFWGHRAASINLSNNTFYFGNGPGGGVSMDRVQRFVFLGGAGNGHITGNGDELTNVSAFRLVATNNATFSYTNDPNLGNMWATTNDDGIWSGNSRAKSLQIMDGTLGIFDNNQSEIISYAVGHNYFWSSAASGSIDGDNFGNFTLQGSGNLKVPNKAFFGITIVTNAQTNLFLTANQLIGSGANKQMEDVFIGAGLTLSGSPKVLSGTGGAGGWGNIADKGTNETALGYFVFVNPTNSNNGTNWTMFTGTNWMWQNVGTNGGGDYKTNTFFWGNGSTSNMFKFANPSGQQMFIATTNGYFNFGTNSQVIFDTSGNITFSGQLNGSGGGLTAGSVALSALPQIRYFSVIGNPNSGNSTPSPIGTESLLDPLGNLLGGLAIRGAGFWTNSGASAITALLSSANVTNTLNANGVNITNQLNLYGLAPASYITIGTASSVSNTLQTTSGSNDMQFYSGNTNFLSVSNGITSLPFPPRMAGSFTTNLMATQLVGGVWSYEMTADAIEPSSVGTSMTWLTNTPATYSTNTQGAGPAFTAWGSSVSASNQVMVRFKLPYDYDTGTINLSLGITGGTNRNNHIAIVSGAAFAVVNTALPAFKSVTNNLPVQTTAWQQSLRITGLTIAGSPTPRADVYGILDIDAGSAGSTFTNNVLVISASIDGTKTNAIQGSITLQ